MTAAQVIQVPIRTLDSVLAERLAPQGDDLRIGPLFGGAQFRVSSYRLA